jgi:hypothetical protein
MTEAVRASETSVYFYETTRRHMTEGCDIQVRIKFHDSNTITEANKLTWNRKSALPYEIRG